MCVCIYVRVHACMCVSVYLYVFYSPSWKSVANLGLKGLIMDSVDFIELGNDFSICG